ncbi:Ecp55 [Fulvia fulva]|uniref:Ecp55 n=1 Tax=Passalora fulva TaxID=5499 RepID=A0A1P8YXP0_PASFU|nr:Ecp55 [Fulvia fulva]AQA29279.1 extracellular protein 55 [Fulvia fulva]KAK4613916.1 Ecp55 [Fulvia fulva]KAK4614817.1 Ecp55 [Fulvia fulva]UJO21678.1 Ecp55 [Fulvia fulva]WPV20369.1 Ecp55 [Fulvia fulva]
MVFHASLLAAASATLVTAAYSSSCSSGPAAEFLLLSNYQPAQQFCAQNYPPPAPKTVTLCSAALSYTGSRKRDDSGSNDDTSNGMPPPARTIFKALLRQDDPTQKIFCACITPPVKPITVIASCAAGQTCSPDGVCRPTRDCSNPASCDGHSFCGKGPTGNNLFCHQDTDNAEMGYCMNDGPADQGCPEPYEDCQANSDCGGSRVCIHSCCRSEPFCVDVMDYRSENHMSPSKMFRRSA